MRYKIEQKRGENDDWIGTCSGVMRETRSEGCHWGKMVSGLARIRGEGGAAELRREALLWKEERDGEQLRFGVRRKEHWGFVVMVQATTKERWGLGLGFMGSKLHI